MHTDLITKLHSATLYMIPTENSTCWVSFLLILLLLLKFSFTINDARNAIERAAKTFLSSCFQSVCMTRMYALYSFWWTHRSRVGGKATSGYPVLWYVRAMSCCRARSLYRLYNCCQLVPSVASRQGPDSTDSKAETDCTVAFVSKLHCLQVARKILEGCSVATGYSIVSETC